jgi:hypothetical protein
VVFGVSLVAAGLYLVGFRKAGLLLFVCQMLAEIGYRYGRNSDFGFMHFIFGVTALVWFAFILVADRRREHMVRAERIPSEQIAGEYCAWLNQESGTA